MNSLYNMISMDDFLGKLIRQMINAGLKMIAGKETQKDCEALSEGEITLKNLGFDPKLYVSVTVLPGEEFRSLEGYESYQISNKGRIIVPLVSYRNYVA